MDPLHAPATIVHHITAVPRTTATEPRRPYVRIFNQVPWAEDEYMAFQVHRARHWPQMPFLFLLPLAFNDDLTNLKLYDGWVAVRQDEPPRDESTQART